MTWPQECLVRVEWWSVCHYRDRYWDKSFVVVEEGESVKLISEFDQSVWKLQMHLKKETYLDFAWNTCEIPMTPQLWVWYSHRYEFPKPYPYPLMSLVPWYGFICFYFCISSISTLMLTCYNAWYWHDALHLVMPRRWTSDLWLDQSLGWPGQCLLHTLQYMSQSFSLSKVSLVPYPLSLFLTCILYFVICFWAVSQMSADTLDTC